jgi:hypothetical protein
MNTTRLAITVTLVLSLTASLAYGLEQVSMDEAETIATNWISLVFNDQGDWGGSDQAYVRETIEYRPEERLLGYCCHVEPQGYIIVSLHEGLAPVKAYSTTCDLDPVLGGSIAEVLRLKITRLHEEIEQRLGPVGTVQAIQLQEIAEIDYRPAWASFNRSPARFQAELEADRVLSNYQEGQWLLTSSWHQGHPYNIYSPTPSDVDDDDCEQDHCAVGCVALAGAMLMHYWCWPPGPNWASMPDRIDATSPGHQIDAVASLCSQIGENVGMDYCAGGGCASSCDTDEMVPLYRYAYGYSPSCDRVDRDDFDTQAGWFAEIKGQISANRPIHYRVPGHSLVADGWKVEGGTNWYHLNMGWDGGRPDKECWEPYEGRNTNTWYALDGIPCSQLRWEYILTPIYPITAVGPAAAGVYPRSAELRYSYFDMDAVGNRAVFMNDHQIQFIPGVTVRCGGDEGIIFYGFGAGAPTRLYTKANVGKGVRIDDGTIVLHRNGGIKLY